ncbi:MAG: DUF4974 domain-containing protein [Chitinophagaceae bacterium]|nr:DUF4974 domain-containing protein [Chitinophagaceae bacterium]
MTKNEIIALLQKHANGEKLSEEEAAQFDYLSTNEALTPDALYEMLLADDRQTVYEEEKWGPVLHKVLIVDKQFPAPSPARVHLLKRWAWAAACVLALLGLAGYFWFTAKKDTAPLVQNGKEVPPGMEGAVLTLANGSQVSLDSIQNGIVALQEGVTARIVNGQLQYEGNDGKVLYNTLSTPKGRQFQVTLPDGTAVWLNALSSIRYPTIFKGHERKVEITGEAYFEVAKNEALPFSVALKGGEEVKVLGTHFNIHAYDNESNNLVTLLEGSVKVMRNQEAVLLKPAQQAILSNTANRAIELASGVNTEQVIAWKNGLFNFSNASLKEVMQQLERWYDIEVVYENNIPDIHFEGEMSKKIPLSGMLTILEKSKVHFKLEGRKLIVIP